MWKTCLGCGARYAWPLAQCPQDGNSSYLEAGTAVTITDPVSSATTGTLTVGHAAQVDTASADCARTLPAAAAAGAAGAVIVWKVDTSAHTVTINPASGDTVEGGSSYVLSSVSGVEVRSDGASDWLVSRLTVPDPILTSIFLSRTEGSSLAGAGASLAVVLDT